LVIFADESVISFTDIFSSLITYEVISHQSGGLLGETRTTLEPTSVTLRFGYQSNEFPLLFLPIPAHRIKKNRYSLSPTEQQINRGGIR